MSPTLSSPSTTSSPDFPDFVSLPELHSERIVRFGTPYSEFPNQYPFSDRHGSDYPQQSISSTNHNQFLGNHTRDKFSSSSSSNLFQQELNAPTSFEYGINSSNPGTTSSNSTAYNQLKIAYTNATNELGLVKQLYQQSQVELQSWKVAHRTLSNTIAANLNTLASRLTSISDGSLTTGTSINSCPLLEQKNFPDVQYWTRDDWMKRVDPGNEEEKGMGRPLRHLEDTDGHMITSQIARDIRDFTHSLLNQINKENPSMVPSSWGEAGLALQRRFQQNLRAEFFVFRLCEGDWKAKQFLTQFYPSWWRTHENKVTVKKEDPGLPQKRASTPMANKRRKRIKHSTSYNTSNDDSDSLQDNPFAVDTDSEESAPIVIARAKRKGKGKERARSTTVLPPVDPFESVFDNVPSSTTFLAPELSKNQSSSSSNSLASSISANTNSSHQYVSSSGSSATSSNNQVQHESNYQSTSSSNSLATPLTSANTSEQAKLPLPVPVSGSNPEQHGNETTNSGPVAPTKQKKGGASKGGAKMRPTDSTTARNLCAHEWVKSNPNGTTEAYDKYWKGLPSTDKKIWTELSIERSKLRQQV